MSSTQFMRIQPYRSASQLHTSSSSSSPHQQSRLSLSSYSSPFDCRYTVSAGTGGPAFDRSSASTQANSEPLNFIHSPICGNLTPELDESNEIIANICPVSPGSSSFPISECLDMNIEDEEETDVGRARRLRRTYSFDLTVFDIRKVPPEQIATQITLLDLEKFIAIAPKELRGGNWNKKDKRQLAPNIMAFTQQFNHTAFLVVQEILREEVEKARAEVISQFIKIAKKLNDLNNLHSLRAVVSALQSAPIHRLSLTWRHVPKKDKTALEKLEELLSCECNWKSLREHMNAHKLPCIPDLSLYLTDLCFLQGLPKNYSKVESIINVVCYFQNSAYDFAEKTHVRKYLTRPIYIEELQKLYEEENYKLSLKLEPRDSEPDKLSTPGTSAPVITPTPFYSPIPPREMKYFTGSLRSSKSCEERLNVEDEVVEMEEVDQENPYAIGKRNSYGRRSLNTNSKGKNNLSPAVKPKFSPRIEQRFKHKNSVPIITGFTKDENFSQSMDMKRVASISSPSSSPLSLLKVRPSLDRSSTESKSKDMKLDLCSLSLSSQSSSTTSSSPSSSTASDRYAKLHSASCSTSSAGSQRHTHDPPLPPSPLLAAKKRGHKKSHSLGTNIMSKYAASKTSTTDQCSHRGLSPEPLRSLIDNSPLVDPFSTYWDPSLPLTPTDSMGNTSTSGDSISHCSMEDLPEELMYFRSVARPDEEAASSQSLSDSIKRGLLKKKDVRHKGSAVSQFKSWSKIFMELFPDKVIFTDMKGRKLGKQVTTVILHTCQLKHRDPRENLGEKQFLTIDDDGNSVKFSARSPGECMEWVVAIKEAIRVLEEKERKAEEQSLIKL